VNRFLLSLLAGVVASAAVIVLTPVPGPTAGLRGGWATAGQDVAGIGTGCDRGGLGTALRTAFAPGVGYTVVAVDVTGIDAGCAGHEVSVALTDNLGSVVSASQPTPVPPGGGTVTVPLPPAAVALAARVHTLIN
jgi:hypothetical protein